MINFEDNSLCFMNGYIALVRYKGSEGGAERLDYKALNDRQNNAMKFLGTNRIIEECPRHGLPEPEFEDTGTAIVVTFRKSIFTPEILLELGLNERQIKAADFIKRHGKITTKDYCDFLKVARDTANKDLKGLLGKNIIKKKGVGPQTHYISSGVSIGQYRTVSDSKTTGENCD